MSLFIGNDIIHLDSIDSTNNYAQYLINNNKAFNGTVVTTKKQFAGKGQRGKVWHSTPNQNLSFSIILKEPLVNLSHQFYLNMAVSIGLTDFLSSLIPKEFNLSIKWPNDILVDNKKICGILIENSIQGNIISSSIIGIGLNVNQEEFNLDVDARQATSLKLCCNKDFELDSILNNILSHIEKYILRLNQHKYEEIFEQYTKKLYLLNQEAKFLYQLQNITATIKGVSTAGKLILQSAESEINCDLKELKYLQ